jgi:hypothetical protein
LLVDPLQRLDAAVDLLVAVLSTNGILEQQLEQGVSMLEALRPREVDPLRIAQALAPVYAARDEPAKQAAMLELIAEKLPLDADPRGRARLLLDASIMRESASPIREALCPRPRRRSAPARGIPRRAPPASASRAPSRPCPSSTRSSTRRRGSSPTNRTKSARFDGERRRSRRRIWETRTERRRSSVAASSSRRTTPRSWLP